MKPFKKSHRHGLMIEGLVMIALGIAAIFLPVFATWGITLLIGAILFIAGLMKIIRSMQFREWPGFGWSMAGGLLLAGAGLFFLGYPETSAALLTVVLALLFLFEGFWEISFSLQFREHGVWKWVLASGILSLAIALLLLFRWPSSAAWAIGLLAGINLVFTGTWLLMLGSAAGELSKPLQELAETNS